MYELIGLAFDIGYSNIFYIFLQILTFFVFDDRMKFLRSKMFKKSYILNKDFMKGRCLCKKFLDRRENFY